MPTPVRNPHGLDTFEQISHIDEFGAILLNGFRVFQFGFWIWGEGLGLRVLVSESLDSTLQIRSSSAQPTSAAPGITRHFRRVYGLGFTFRVYD